MGVPPKAGAATRRNDTERLEKHSEIYTMMTAPQIKSRLMAIEPHRI